VSTQLLWFATRGAGIVSLILFSVVACLGLLAVARAQSTWWPRFLTVEVHRSLALLSVAFLAVHILTAVLDPFTHLGLAAAILPLASSYRPVQVALGVVSVYFAAAMIITSLLRDRLGHRAWRTVHWLAYAFWPEGTTRGAGGDDSSLASGVGTSSGAGSTGAGQGTRPGSRPAGAGEASASSGKAPAPEAVDGAIQVLVQAQGAPVPDDAIDHALSAMRLLSKPEGFQSVSYRLQYPPWWLASEQASKKASERMRPLAGCDNLGSRPLQHLHITPHGKCLLCCEDYDEQHVVGDLNTSTVAEVLAGPEIARLRRWVYGLEEAPADFMCRKCIFARAR